MLDSEYELKISICSKQIIPNSKETELCNDYNFELLRLVFKNLGCEDLKKIHTVKTVLLWNLITVLNYSFVFEYIYIYLVISSGDQHQSSVSHDPSEIILIGGVLDLKRRCTEWSAYDSRVPRELFESFRICLLSYGSRGTVMLYADHSVPCRFKSNTPIVI